MAREVDGVAVTLPALTVVEGPPATVTQRTCERHFGLSPTEFKRLCADGRLPGRRHGRTWVVGYEEGRHALLGRPTPTKGRTVEGPEADVPATDAPRGATTRRTWRACSRGRGRGPRGGAVPRKRTGFARYVSGKWRAVFWDGGVRRTVTFHHLTREVEDRARAHELAAQVSQQAAERLRAPERGRDHGAPDGAPVRPPLDEYPDVLPDGRETFAGWASRWCAERERKGLRSVRDERSRLRYHVLPLLGRYAMKAIARTDLETLVADLDKKVEDGRLSWKTAQNIWGIVGKAFDDARRSKRPELRAREDDPSDGVRGPDRGAEKAKNYLFPSEFLKLVSCLAVPLERRRLYALAAYTGLRRGELAALRAPDVQLEFGYLAVHKALDRDDEERPTKTKVARKASVESEARPLLAFFAQRPGPKGRLVEITAATHLAEQLREDLRASGVLRADLFASDAVRKPVGFHDLRGTHATWMACRGDDAFKIQRRLGHADLKTTQIYVREAELLADAGVKVEPFPPLPAELYAAPTEHEPGGP